MFVYVVVCICLCILYVCIILDSYDYVHPISLKIGFNFSQYREQDSFLYFFLNMFIKYNIVNL